MKSNVIDALKFTAKLGFIDCDIWINKFSTGSERWRFKLLQNLVKRNLLNRHPSDEIKGVYILGSKGKEFLDSLNLNFISYIPIGQLEHDRFVGKTLWNLYETGMISNWLNERELRKLENKEYFLKSEDKVPRYPDSVFSIKTAKGPAIIAFEYEKTCKSRKRYKQLLLQYAFMKKLNLIVFVCRDTATRNMIQSTVKGIGNKWLDSRVALVSEFDWGNDMLNAPLEIDHVNYYLKNFIVNDNLNDQVVDQVHG